MQLEALRRYVAQNPAAPLHAGPSGDGHVVVVGSGKGGVGTSLLAALLALGAAARGARTLLIDGDATLGSLHLLLGAEPGPGLEALRGGTAPDELLVHLTDGLHLLPGGEPAMMSGVERQALYRRLGGLHPLYDLVVVDGGSRLDSVLAVCAAGSARVLIASTVERIALTATYALAKVLADRHPTIPVGLILNRTEPEAADAAFAEVRGALKHFLRRTVDYAGCIPDDECLRAALEAGMDLQDAAVGSPAAARLEVVAASLITQLTPTSHSERRHLPRRS